LFLKFILGNAYQSVLISLMAESRYGDQITTIQGMIDSNFTFMVHDVFMEMFKSSEMHEELLNKITGIVYKIADLDFGKLAAEKVGLILACNSVDLMYRESGELFEVSNNAIDYYYRVNERFYNYYQRFPTAPYSPFTDRLQDYSLTIHESGVKQHWQTLLSFVDMAEVKQREYNANEEYLLNLGDMKGL
jgi:hypothetical protein